MFRTISGAERLGFGGHQLGTGSGEKALMRYRSGRFLESEANAC